MNPTKNKLLTGILLFSLPILADQIFISLTSSVTLAYCRGLGVAATSAVGMIASFNQMASQIFLALASGGSVVIAQRVGAGDKQGAGETAWQAIANGTIAVTLVTLLGFLFRRSILYGLFSSVEEEVMQIALPYFSLSVFSYPLLFFTTQGYNILRGFRDSRTPMKINIVSSLFDMALGRVLIPGIAFGGRLIGGFGALGAGWALIIARLLSSVLVALALGKDRNGLRVPFTWRYKIDIAICKAMYGIGIPSATEKVVFTMGRLMTQVFVSTMGTTALAVNSIANALSGYVYLPSNAYILVSQTTVGLAVGEGDSEKAKKTLTYNLLIVWAGVALIGGVQFLFMESFTGLFTADPEVIRQASRLLRGLVLAALLVYPCGFLLPGGFRGAGDVRLAFWVIIGSMWVFRVGLGYLLGVELGLGIQGLYAGMYMDWACRGVIFFLYYRRGGWLKKCGLCDTKSPAAKAAGDG